MAQEEGSEVKVRKLIRNYVQLLSLMRKPRKPRVPRWFDGSGQDDKYRNRRRMDGGSASTLRKADKAMRLAA